MPSEHLEPQAYRVQQGSIFTASIFHDGQMECEEDLSTCIATFNSPQECADFIDMHNRLIDKIDLLEYELNEALAELRMHGV